MGGVSEVGGPRRPSRTAAANKTKTSTTPVISRLFKAISYFADAGRDVLADTWLRGTGSTLRLPL